MLALMEHCYKHFKLSFLALIDKILIVDEKDHMIKGLYKLLERFYLEINS